MPFCFRMSIHAGIIHVYMFIFVIYASHNIDMLYIK